MLQNNCELNYLASNYMRIFNLQNEAFRWMTSFPRYSLNSLRLVLFQSSISINTAFLYPIFHRSEDLTRVSQKYGQQKQCIDQWKNLMKEEYLCYAHLQPKNKHDPLQNKGLCKRKLEMFYYSQYIFEDQSFLRIVDQVVLGLRMFLVLFFV